MNLIVDHQWKDHVIICLLRKIQINIELLMTIVTKLFEDKELKMKF